jgi:hypothetical protein
MAPLHFMTALRLSGQRARSRKKPVISVKESIHCLEQGMVSDSALAYPLVVKTGTSSHLLGSMAHLALGGAREIFAKRGGAE